MTIKVFSQIIKYNEEISFGALWGEVNKMNGIAGNLCKTPEDLRKEASIRKKIFEEISISPSRINEIKNKNYEVVREGKSRIRLKKSKSPDVLLEDRVWMILYNLGFNCMNKGRGCTLEFDTYSKRVDILARDEENIFVIECKSSAIEDPINAKDALEEYVGKRQDIQKAIETTWGKNCGRINIVVVIGSMEKRDKDVEYVKIKGEKNIFLWSKRELDYIERLIKQIGNSAKYQLYSVIFLNRKQKSLEIKLPAIKGKIGGNTFYTFVISAKQLLKYAYVHHRHLTGIIEASQVYQRMLRHNKLKEIAKFIDHEDGYFPNSIIVNFTSELHWDKKEKFNDDIAMGIITLPQHYGCAWIIDGQHRLYGASQANSDVLLPVLAFENITSLDQANLFVEINEKQTSVDKHLLWDLYSDIYRESKDPKQKKLFQIAEIGKMMEKNGPLSGCIDIPSIPADRPVKFSLTTICSTIEKYSPWDYLKSKDDESKTPENATRMINSYFSVLKTLWPEDWNKGNKGILLTNNGFGVFMMIYEDIIKHMAYKKMNSLFQAARKREFEDFIAKEYLRPIIEFLKTDLNTQRDIKKKTGRGPQSDNAGYLELKIQEFIPDFWSVRMRTQPTVLTTAKPTAISNIEEKARNAEGKLRSYINDQLQSHYGSDKWWKQGIPQDLKKICDQKWEKNIKRKPYLYSHDNQNTLKFEYLGLGELQKIIVTSDNWTQIFEPKFLDRSNVERRIGDICALRNPISHERKIDDQDVIDGISGLLWLSKCLNDPELNPYS